MRMHEESSPVKVRYKAFPLHTQIPFVLVLAYPIFFILRVGLQNGGEIWWPSVGVCLTLVFLVCLMMGIVREFVWTKLDPQPLESLFPDAWRRMTELVAPLGWEGTVFVSDRIDSPQVLHNRPVVPLRLAQAFGPRIEEVDEAVLLHELGHVLQGAGRRFITTFAVNRAMFGGLTTVSCGVAGCLFFAFGGLCCLVLLIGFVSGAFLWELTDWGIIPEIIVDSVVTFWFVGTAAGMYAFYVNAIRRLERRSAEFAADAFAVAAQGGAGFLRSALIRQEVRREQSADGQRHATRESLTFAGSLETSDGGGRSHVSLGEWVRRIWLRVFPPIPTIQERLAALESLWYALDEEATAVVIGLLICLYGVSTKHPDGLDMELGWMFSSTFIVGFLGLLRYSFAHALRGGSDARRIVRGVVRDVLFLLVGAGLGLFLLAVHGVLTRLLEKWIEGVFFFVEIRPAVLWEVLAASAVLCLILVVSALFVREQFTAYSVFPKKWPPEWLNLLGRTLESNDRRICPDCGKPVPGYFWIGRRCDSCGHRLHGWLYQD